MKNLASDVAETMTQLRAMVDRATDELFRRYPEDADPSAWDNDDWNDVREACLSAEQSLFEAQSSLGLGVQFDRAAGAFVTKPEPVRFDYYQIRAAVDFENDVSSYLGDGTPAGALAEAERCAGGRPVFWTIYGMAASNTLAIGDFKSFEAAYEVMQAMLLPLRDAVGRIEDGAVESGAADIEDILNQSSTDERL